MVRPNLKKAASSDNVFYSLVLAHVYFEYVRPASVFPFLSPFKLGGLLLLVSLFVWFKFRSKEIFKDSLVKLYCIGLLQMVIWVPLAVNNRMAFNNAFNLIYYLFGAILPLAALVNSESRLKHFFHHWVIINFLVALVTVRAGGKGTGGFLADENDVGLAMNMALPYAAYLFFSRENSKRRRWFYGLATAVILFAVVYSRSRGAMVGFFAVLLTMWLLSRNKMRNLAVATTVIILFGGVILSLLPPGYYERMLTAGDPNNSTRIERIYSWKIGWVMFTHNPIFGVGPGNYPYRVVDYQDLVERPRGRPPIPGRVAHSFYFTLLPELGIMGAGIFVWMSAILVSRMKTIYKFKQSDASDTLHTYGLIAKANIASLAAYLSAGAFITVNYYPCYWFLIGFALLLHRQFTSVPEVMPLLSRRRLSVSSSR